MRFTWPAVISLSFLAVALVARQPAAAGDADPVNGETPVVATIETTLDTATGQIRQFALDGDAGTFFASARNAAAADHFALVFDKPVAVKSIAVVTGRPDGSGRIEMGTLDVSDDGKTFGELAAFADGSARGEPKDRKILAIRIRPGADLKHFLAIREFTIVSDPPVAIFKYPVEFTVDVTDAPEMKEWADKVARICERAYPMINEELKSDDFRPAHRITMSLKKDYKGVAATSGFQITGSVKFFKDHPDDIGAMIHETVHVVQWYQGGNPPGWLVEGVADYIRFFKYEPGNLGRIDPDRAHYNGSYRVTAAFLAYLTEKYDRQIVRKLNRIMREGKYKEDLFKELTGKPLQELDDEWRATLRR